MSKVAHNIDEQSSSQTDEQRNQFAEEQRSPLLTEIIKLQTLIR